MNTVSITSLPLRLWRQYVPLANLHVQTITTYNGWFWVSIGRSVIAMLIFTSFWKAVYAGQNGLSGLNLEQTLNYVILARALGDTNSSGVFWNMAYGIRQGELELQLLRPLDFQVSHLVQDFAGWFANSLRAMPILIIGLVAFGARLPSDPMAYLAFLATFVFGGVLLFMLDYALGCITFYTTEVWGLGILRDGVALFLSGALIPLEFLPEGIRAIANFSPWAQALYVPISFLSGIRNPNTLPQAILGQLFGIVILCLISRWIFSRAVRVLTVQGG